MPPKEFFMEEELDELELPTYDLEEVSLPKRKRSDDYPATGILDDPKIAAIRALSGLCNQMRSRIPFVLITTPADINSVRDELYGDPIPDLPFSCARGYFQNKGDIVSFPGGAPEFKAFSTAMDVARYIGNQRFVIFNESTLEETINAVLIQNDRTPLPPSNGMYLNQLAASAGDTVVGLTAWNMAVYQMAVDISIKEKLSPQLGITVIYDIFSDLASYEERKQNFSHSADRFNLANDDVDDFDDVFKHEQGKVLNLDHCQASNIAFQALATGAAES